MKREDIKDFLKEVLTGLEEQDDLVEIRRKVKLAAIGLGDYVIKNILPNHPCYHYEFKKAVKKFETDVEKAFSLK